MCWWVNTLFHLACHDRYLSTVLLHLTFAAAAVGSSKSRVVKDLLVDGLSQNVLLCVLESE